MKPLEHFCNPNPNLSIARNYSLVMQGKKGLKGRAYFHFQEITDYHEELDAHREIVKMIDDQIMLHELYQKEVPPQKRAM